MILLADLITNVAATNVEQLSHLELPKKIYYGTLDQEEREEDNGYIMTSHISILSSKVTDSQ